MSRRQTRPVPATSARLRRTSGHSRQCSSQRHEPMRHAAAHGRRSRHQVRRGRWSGDETVLLLNPWPESLFAWETIWTRLAETARLVAIDLPGFGQSEAQGLTCSPRGPWACSCCASSTNGDWAAPIWSGPTSEPVRCCSRHPRTSTDSPAPSSAAAARRSRWKLRAPSRSIIEAPDLTGFQGARRTRHRRGSPRRHRAAHTARGRTRGLPGVLRGRSIRRVGGLRPQLSDRPAGPRRTTR